MSDSFPAGHRNSIDNSLRPLRGSKTTQLVLAVCCFALPLFLIPLASRESDTELWVASGLSRSIVKKVFIPGGTASLLYALVADQGIYRSGDNGLTWRAMNNGLPLAQWGRIAVQALAVDEVQSFVLYAGMADAGRRDSAFGTGLYLSDDGGSTWLASARDMVGKEVQAIAVMPTLALGRPGEAEPRLRAEDEGTKALSVVCVATSGELYRSMDRGGSWSRLDWRGVDTRILSLAVRPGNPDAIYVGTQGGGIYGTENGGASWVAMNQDLGDLDVYDITISVTEPGLMYLATNGGAYNSQDAGMTWTKLGGATEGRIVNTITVHPQDGNVLYAGLQHGAAYRSTDGGRKWTPLKRGLGDLTVLSLAVDPHDKSILWAGTTNGIWRHVARAPASLTPTGTVSTASATPEPEPASAGTATRTATSTRTRTAQPTATTSATAPPTNTATATPTVSPTLSPTATLTATPTATQTPTWTPTSTVTTAPPPRTPVPGTPTDTPPPR